MVAVRSVCAVLFLVLLACAVALPADAQTKQDSVELIISKPEAEPGKRHPIRAFFQNIKQRISSIKSRILPLTHCEKWSVPKEKVAAVKKAAAKRGVVVTELSPGWNQVFRAFSGDLKMNDKQKAMMERTKASKATSDIRIMAGPSPAVLEHALTQNADAPGSAEAAKITVQLNDNKVLTVQRTSVDIKSDMCIWRGTVEETGALVTLMWWPNGTMAGRVEDAGRIYSIRHVAGRFYAVVALSDERMPQEHAPMSARLRTNDPNLRDDPLLRQGDASKVRAAADAKQRATPLPKLPLPDQSTPAPFKKAGSGKDIVIDVIVAYTAKAASYYSDVKRELVDLAIEEGNESFRMSNLGNIKLRLVHAYQTDYVEQGEHFDHVWRFADKGDGYMDEIHGLRDKYKADVAVLIVDDASGCGLATRVYADAEDAFAVVHHECAVSSYSLAHEIGHLIGARHDLVTDNNMTPFPYGHGYVNGTKWRDIMSYKSSCNGCPRLPVWSSPKVLIKGEPAGTAELDNARVILEQAARVAAFR